MFSTENIKRLSQISGVSFAEARGHVVTAKYGEVEIRVIGKEQLLINKISTNRLKDKADTEEIRREDRGSLVQDAATPSPKGF